MKLWTLCCGRGYHIALLRYAAEDEDYYLRATASATVCGRSLSWSFPTCCSPVRTARWRRQVRELDELNDYIEVLHGDTHLPGEESTASRWEVNPNRRIHVRAVQPVLHSAKPCPRPICGRPPCRSALEQYHLALHNCPAQKQQMRDVLVYPEREPLQPEEQLFVQLLHKRGGCHHQGQRVEEDLKCAPLIGLRHPASTSCLGRHLRLAGRCPNNSSLFPPLAAVVVVAAEELFFKFWGYRNACGRFCTLFSRVPRLRGRISLLFRLKFHVFGEKIAND